MTLSRTWLVQRLNKPLQSYGVLGPDNPFAFGGGLMNGGLSAEAMSLLRPIFSFDYMGAAEFEFGAVPEALNRIAERAHAGTLAAHTFEISLSEVEADYVDRTKPAPSGAAPVYVLGPADDLDEIEARVRSWAAERYNTGLKETTHLALVLRPRSDRDDDWMNTRGWLELDNGFLFFTDEDMFTRTAELFGVRVTVSAED